MVTLLIVISLILHSALALQPIPNFNYLLDSYDVRQAQSKNYESAVRNPVFLATFDTKQVFHVPPNQTYLLPDQMTALYTPITEIVNTEDIYDHLEHMISEHCSSYDFHVGFGVDKLGVNADYNRTEYYIHDIFRHDTLYAASGHVSTTIYRYILAPPVLLDKSPFFRRMLDRIPSCPSNQDALRTVQQLIDSYGHVQPLSVIMGGQLDTIASIEQHIFKEFERHWVYQQWSLSFSYDNFIFDPHGFSNRSDIHIDDAFRKASHSRQFFIGGNRIYHTNRTLEQWFHSVSDEPAMIGGSFILLSELEETDAVKRDALSWLLTRHIGTGLVDQVPPCAHQYALSDGQYLSVIPGFQFVGSGFHTRRQRAALRVTALDVPHEIQQDKKHENPSFDHAVADANDVIAAATDEVQVWQNPFYPDYRYAIPRTVHVETFTESMERNETFIAMNKADYEHTASYTESHETWFGKDSTQFILYTHYYSYQTTFMVHHTQFLSWYKLHLSPMMRIKPVYDTWFARYLQLLKDADTGSRWGRRLFCRFFDIFGDAVIVGVTMGGRVTFRNWVQRSVLDTMTLYEVHTHSSSSFLGVFGSHSDYDSYVKNRNAVFASHSKMEIKVEGGHYAKPWEKEQEQHENKIRDGFIEVNPLALTGPLMEWKKYAKTIKDNMAPLRYEVIPMEELLHVEDAELRIKMKTMRLAYVNDETLCA